MVEKIDDILIENKKRLSELYSAYDPIRGIGSPIPRKKISYTFKGETEEWYCPVEMIEKEPLINAIVQAGSIEAVSALSGKSTPDKLYEYLNSERFKYDFEYWGVTTVKIQIKKTKKIIPFILNAAQRWYLSRLEKMRLAGAPIRVILLKARQWGGSTLTQIYMAWIQLIHKENWHSAIIADVDDQARNVRGMYKRLIDNYPIKYTMAPHEGSSKNKIIQERGNIIGIGSMQKPENLRSFDFSMLHMSELGQWKETKLNKPEDLVQGTLIPTVPTVPLSMIVMESTAKGVGNFFHKEWVASYSGESSYDPVFIPWYSIEMYQENIPFNDYKAFVKNFTPYHWFLWESGATLEGINWYFNYKKSYRYTDWMMQSQFPTNPQEAFQSTGQRVFPPIYVQDLRRSCTSPLYTGDIYPNAVKGPEALKIIRFEKHPSGNAWVWALPDKETNCLRRYVVTLDIGGKSSGADYSVITVLDRYWQIDGGSPERVFTWKGHLDQDLVIWKAIQVAKFYNNALFVPEDNSIDRKEGTEGDHFLTILDEIKEVYDNIYCRTPIEKVIEGVPAKYGFWTGHQNKTMIMDNLLACARDGMYTEKDSRNCDEMDSYEVKPNGTLGAVDGAHDDILMTTAIALWAATSHMERPIEINPETKKKSKTKQIVSEATM
jgi:hypothetical protein